MQCSHCGKHVDAGEGFCGECGARMPAVAPAAGGVVVADNPTLEALVRGEPVARVAESNGYRGASAFAAAFRKVMGVAPSAVARSDWDGGGP